MIQDFDPAAAVAAFYASQQSQEKPKRKETRKGGDRHKHSRGNRHKSSWQEKHFIAWDGEGKDLTPTNDFGDRPHIYNFLANSEGAELFSEGESGLSSEDCLDLLCDSAEEYPNAINVVFGGSYDMNMILRDLPREKMEEICANDGRDFTTWGRFAIRLVQRKYLSVGRYADEKQLFRQKKNGEWERNLAVKTVLWDVIGFFQSAFIPTVEGWLGKDYPDLKLIREGKEKRKDFKTESLDFIRRYNNAELRALVRLMEKVHEAMEQLGLKLTRWDGAGAVAAAINTKHDVKKWLGQPRRDSDDPIQRACQHAYFGGRIELGRYGYHDGKIYHYDVNSAYPSQQRHLPQMLQGTWVNYKAGDAMLDEPDKLPHITCYLVKWDFRGMGVKFGPFPYRSEMQRKVLFPEAGMNWVWKPEVCAALRVFDGKGFEILEAWSWHPTIDYRPYYWIDEYYDRRQELCELQKKLNQIFGEEKVIKLGLNSLYGKTAQRAGYNEKTGRIPPYHNLAYAGYITSGTRALLWEAAMQKQEAIICLATDGVFSTSPLALDCPQKKTLGKWEEQTHDGMILAQSGFYWIKDGDDWRGWSRGFDKIQKGPNYQKEMRAQIDQVLKTWKKGEDETYFPCTRFITAKTALSGDQWWPRWCSWYSMRTPEGIIGRRLKLYPTGTKRVSQKGKPWREMVGTIPETNYTPDTMSMLYNIPWIMEDEENETAINNEVDIADE